MAQCLCPDFTAQDEKEWDNKEFLWDSRSFYIFNIPMLFHAPRMISRKINKSIDEITAKGFQVKRPVRIISRDGWFSGQLLVEIASPDEVNPRVFTFRNTRFISRVFRGKNYLLSRVVREFVAELEHQGKVVIDIYYWYITCPLCAAEKGYKTVILAQIE